MVDQSLDMFFEICPSMLFVADVDLTLRRTSTALEQVLGLAPGAVLRARVHKDDQPRIDAALAGLNEEDTVDIEIRVVDGTETWVPVRCRMRRDGSGSLFGELLVQEIDRATRETQSRTHQVERRLLRALMENLEIVLWAVDRDGTFIYHDGKALADAGLERRQFLGMNIFELYPADASSTIRAAFTGTASQEKSEVHGVNWESWTLPVFGDVGEVDYCVGISLNVTESTTREKRLTEQIDTITAQQQAIQELSAPLIEVWDRVVTVPLIGVVDSTRAKDLMERLLAEVSRIGAKFVIVDLTGVEAVDSVTASYITRMLSALRLLGAEGLISGINPYVAQTMVGIGIDMSMVRTFANLRDCLRYCMANE